MNKSSAEHSILKSAKSVFLASTMVLALAGSVLVQPGIASPALAAPVAVNGPQVPSFADVVSAVTPAVVSVRVESEIQPASDDGSNGGMPFDRRFPNMPGFPFEFFQNGPDGGADGDMAPQGPRGHKRQGQPQAMSQGSGFFVSEDGYVVTNNHVVENGTKFSVLTSDGTEMEAKLIGTDQRTDLAVLKVEPKGTKLTYVAFGNKDPRIGEWVVAVGNPFGLGGTVTAGIVSARGREISDNSYDDYLQIDAAVNKGNSGGPAFDLNGNVVGINTAIFSPSGGNVGIAFAIPAETAKTVVADLISDGKVVRGWLGVQIQPVSSEIADSLGLQKAEGAIVTAPQSDGPAAKAGIKAGDVILSVGDKEVKSPKTLARIIGSNNPDSTVDLKVWRDGKEDTVSVKLGTMDGVKMASRDGGAQAAPASLDGIGVELQPGNNGLIISNIDENGAAASRGMRKGDVIRSVNGEAVNNAAEVSKAMASAAKLGRNNVLFQIDRDNASTFIPVPIAKAG